MSDGEPIRIGEYDARLVFLNNLGDVDPEHGRLWRTDAQYRADTDAVAHLVAMVIGILQDECKIHDISVHHILVDELAKRCVDGRHAQETAKRLVEFGEMLPGLPPKFDKPN